MSENEIGIRKRSEIETKNKWDIEAMYENDEVWEADYRQAEEMATDFTSFAGHLAESEKTLLRAFKARTKCGRRSKRCTFMPE